jgi:hypothetical protein
VKWSAVSVSGFVIFDQTAGLTRLVIDTSGNCQNTTGTWSAVSDPRTKSDIAAWSDGLAALLELQPITFRYNGLADTPDDGRVHLGLDAAAVLAVLPELVLAAERKLNDIDEEPSQILSVDVGKLVFPLINAVKELAARLAAVEARP